MLEFYCKIAICLFVLMALPIATLESSIILPGLQEQKSKRFQISLGIAIIGCVVWCLVMWLTSLTLQLTTRADFMLTMIIATAVSGLLITLSKWPVYGALSKQSLNKSKHSMLVFVFLLLINILIPAGAIPLTFIATVVSDAFYERNCQNIAPLPFDKEVWSKASEGDDFYSAKRQRMLNDLIKRYSLRGMTKERAVELLGGGDLNRTDKELTYKIGPAGWDSMWLTLDLVNDTVTNYRVWGD